MFAISSLWSSDNVKHPSASELFVAGLADVTKKVTLVLGGLTAGCIASYGLGYGLHSAGTALLSLDRTVNPLLTDMCNPIEQACQEYLKNKDPNIFTNSNIEWVANRLVQSGTEIKKYVADAALHVAESLR